MRPLRIDSPILGLWGWAEGPAGDPVSEDVEGLEEAAVVAGELCAGVGSVLWAVHDRPLMTKASTKLATLATDGEDRLLGLIEQVHLGALMGVPQGSGT